LQKQQTEALRRRPFSILLFDEIEKASKEVLTVFLQLMDDGRITDGKGRVVDGRNCFIVMTSNLGAEFLASKDNEIDPLTREKIQGAIRDHFLPEFLNRISKPVIFQPLSRKEIRAIVDLRLGEVQHRLKQNRRNITIQCAEEVKDHIAESGFSHVYGARQLGRVIEQKVLDPLAVLILRESIRDGEPARVVMRNDQIVVLPNDQIVVLPNDQEVSTKTKTRSAARKAAARKD
jgi:ATP-dependent Clp protease ATP-binding subunit ClpA